MIINLLCFFILMNTFANRQEAGLVADDHVVFAALRHAGAQATATWQ